MFKNYFLLREGNHTRDLQNPEEASSGRGYHLSGQLGTAMPLALLRAQAKNSVGFQFRGDWVFRVGLWRNPRGCPT